MAPSEAGRPPVADVIARHAPELLTVPGVAGLYESVLENGGPCITIAVVHATPALRAALPESLEGYPVVIQETGEIVPH